jgi:hypothetical protein
MWLVMKDIDIGKAAQIKRGAGADEGPWCPGEDSNFHEVSLRPLAPEASASTNSATWAKN